MQEAVKQGANSVTDYLAALTWDGTPRIDRWLVDCAGAEDVPRVREVSRRMLVAAVRRARSPGCRFDQLPIFVGPPGSGKSSVLRELVRSALDEPATMASLVDRCLYVEGVYPP